MTRTNWIKNFWRKLFPRKRWTGEEVLRFLSRKIGKEEFRRLRRSSWPDGCFLDFAWHACVGYILFYNDKNERLRTIWTPTKEDYNAGDWEVVE